MENGDEIKKGKVCRPGVESAKLHRETIQSAMDMLKSLKSNDSFTIVVIQDGMTKIDSTTNNVNLPYMLNGLKKAFLSLVETVKSDKAKNMEEPIQKAKGTSHEKTLG